MTSTLQTMLLQLRALPIHGPVVYVRAEGSDPVAAAAISKEISDRLLAASDCGSLGSHFKGCSRARAFADLALASERLNALFDDKDGQRP